MTYALTRRQKDCLEFIEEYFDQEGVPPSFDEILVALGLRSKSGVHRIVAALEERGAIVRMPKLARSTLPVSRIGNSALVGEVQFHTGHRIPIEPSLMTLVRARAKQMNIPARELVNTAIREALA
ncbi:MAG: hypothetical protein JJ902_03905 [Roseibium sp.]|nr:hypothetical protein [Roseibium sp.]